MQPNDDTCPFILYILYVYTSPYPIYDQHRFPLKFFSTTLLLLYIFLLHKEVNELAKLWVKKNGPC